MILIIFLHFIMKLEIYFLQLFKIILIKFNWFTIQIHQYPPTGNTLFSMTLQNPSDPINSYVLVGTSNPNASSYLIRFICRTMEVIYLILIKVVFGPCLMNFIQLMVLYIILPYRLAFKYYQTK